MTRTIRRAIAYPIAAVALAFFVFPICWIMSTSLKSGDWMYKIPPVWVSPQPTLQHFALFIHYGGARVLANSMVISSLTTLVSLLIGSLAAYGLARYRVGGENLPFLVLSQRFMPAVAVIFPFLLLFRTLRWMDTYQALIIVYLTFNLPYAVWMMRGFFLELPREIEESALVDGCSPLAAFWRIALPLASPGLVATGVFCFLFSWTEFFFALCLTRTDVVPLSVFIASYFGKGEILWGQIASTSVIAMLPLFLVAMCLQPYLVRGLSLGALR